VDLSLLPHLSDDALRREARRLGISETGLDREALIGAIRDAETRATAPTPREHSTPSALAGARSPAEPRSGALETARALLGSVLGMAKSALDRRALPEAIAEPPKEPIRTRTMARLLLQQGHEERALSILRELARTRPEDSGLSAEIADLERRIDERDLRERCTAMLEVRAGSFCAVVSAGALRAAVWRVDEAGHTRARTLLGSPGALTLRTISVVARSDYAVHSERSDRRPLEPSGWAHLDVDAGARVVVSVGLAEDDRFVSIAHATHEP